MTSLITSLTQSKTPRTHIFIECLTLLTIFQMNGIVQNYSISRDKLYSSLADGRRVALPVAMLPLVMSLYLLFVTITYELRVSRPCHRKDREAEKFRKTDGRMRRIILCAACVIAGRQILRTLEASEGFESDYICSVLRKVTDALFVFALTLIYFALWIRQRVFYKSSLSASFETTFTRMLSVTVLMFIIAGAIGGLVLYLGTLTYKSSDRGCIVNGTSIPGIVPPAYYITTLVLFQLILLVLFVYPLLKHRRLLDKTQLHTFSRSTYRLLRRVALVTAVDVILDVVIFITIQFQHTFSWIYVFFLIDLTVLKSCVCVICSFSDWHLHLAPCKCLVKIRPTEDSVNQMTLVNSTRI